jgi:hypothetical protein
LPKNGQHCPYSSLPRTALDLITRPQPANNFDPPVISKVFRPAGSRSGIRLIDLASLLAYLDSLPAARPEKSIS